MTELKTLNDILNNWESWVLPTDKDYGEEGHFQAIVDRDILKEKLITEAEQTRQKCLELEIQELFEIIKVDGGMSQVQEMVLYQTITNYKGKKFNEFMDKYLKLKRN